MEIISSYAIEIKHMDKCFRYTIRIFNDAVSFCVKVFEDNWNDLKELKTSDKSRFRYADKLIHSTSSNTAKYPDFDKKFYKLPSFLRFSVINTALGYLSSYHSNLLLWENSKQNTKKPSIQYKLNEFPSFYKENMYDENECFSNNTVKLKLFMNNDWVWVDVKLKPTDVKNILKRCKTESISSPTIKKENKKWVLRFAFTKSVKLNNTKINEQNILAVDLGINTDATCSIMNKEGTVLERKFINFKSEKDLLYHTLNKIKKAQKKYGSNNITKLWKIAKFRNDELAKKIAKEIVTLAKKNNCDVIVFEHLDVKGKKKGSKKEKLQMWKKNTIQKIVENKAHKEGIRISRICAYNTSKLAFDGSGEVLRGKKENLPTYELCLFKNNKVYNCDLSASYNIGARYFLREIQKTTSVKKWSGIVAKVPECQKRTQCTYSTLLKVNKLLKEA